MRTKFKVAIAAALLALPVATIVHPVDAATKVTVVKLKKAKKAATSVFISKTTHILFILTCNELLP